MTAVSVEPSGAVARRRLVGRAGYEPHRAHRLTSSHVGQSHVRNVQLIASTGSHQALSVLNKRAEAGPFIGGRLSGAPEVAPHRPGQRKGSAEHLLERGQDTLGRQD
jgi:hypothetical protein